MADNLGDFAGLLFPSACWQCDHPVASAGIAFCEACEESLREPDDALCPRCASATGAFSFDATGCPRCRDDRFHFARTYRAGPYKEELRSLVLRMKSPGQEAFASRLAEWWARRMKRELANESFDIIVPVPLHWYSRWRRGFNQCRFLADALAKELGKPTDHRALRRVRRAASQKLLSGAERRRSLKQAFHVDNPESVRGKAMLLVDDVLTSGSTADACAKALSEAGAGCIAVAVVAKG